MEQPHFADRLEAAIVRCRTAAVVGLDPVAERLPSELRPARSTSAAWATALRQFCSAVVDQVADLVPAVKINSAFFEACYAHGVAEFQECIAYARQRGLLVIADVKRGDIGSTAEFYARGHLSQSRFEDLPESAIPDAVTLSGYLGEGSVAPFIKAAREHGRGMYVLVRPSDPGADRVHEFGQPTRLYEHMADLVAQWGRDLIGQSGLSAVGGVVAAKDVPSTRGLRERMSHTPWLVPGYGAQGAAADACAACFLPGGRGAIINASRSVIYAFESSEKPEADWREAIRSACVDFVKDIARLQRSAPS